jgi:cyclopropane fatty-acyl-phospholipid synthase-like methyltransferase
MRPAAAFKIRVGLGIILTMEKDYYENPANVENYSKFNPEHDGALLIDALCAWLTDGSSVLELGIGPGKDFDLLSKHFKVTGSDFSGAFLERYRARNPVADLLQLDARTLATERHFDGIFSNKVLIHLSPKELTQSFSRQHQLLNDGGVILHSFWYGEGDQQFGDLTLRRRNEHDLALLLEDKFDVLALERHAKMKEGDSIYVVARKKSSDVL